MLLWCPGMSVVLVFNVGARKIVITRNECSLIHTVHLTDNAGEFAIWHELFWLRFVSDQSLTSPVFFLMKNYLTS